MNVLVDTSVWIRGLSRRGPHSVRLGALLSDEQVSGHEFVFGELRAGDRGGRGSLLSVYQRFHQARTVPHLEVVEFVRQRRLHGRGVGWIDLHLLASAMVEGLKLWTADLRLFQIAREMGISFD